MKLLYKVRSWTRCKHGISPRALKTLFDMVITAKLGYAVTCWAPALQKRFIEHKLLSLQSNWARSQCRTWRNSAGATNILLSGTPPIILTLKALACRGLLHLPSYIFNQDTDHPEILAWADQMTLDRRQSYSKALPQPVWDPKTVTPWTITIDPKEAAKSAAISHSGTAVYTDGSSTREKGIGSGVGFATVHCFKGQITKVLSESLPPDTSILEAEICAIREALTQYTSGKEVMIFTDSQAALALLADENCSYPLVHECQQIARVRPPHIFHLRWIPAHAGIQLHDIADLSAKQASIKPILEPRSARLPLPKDKTKQKANAWIREETAKQWKGSLLTLGRTARNAFPELESAALVQKRLLQEPCYQLAQLLTAHCNLNAYRRGSDPLCKLCKTTEDARHHVFVCKAYKEQRNKLRKKCGGRWKPNFEFLITDKGRLTALVEYLRETGRISL